MMSQPGDLALPVDGKEGLPVGCRPGRGTWSVVMAVALHPVDVCRATVA